MSEVFPCPNCSHLNTFHHYTCKICGAALKGYCPKCKHPIRHGEYYCSECPPNKKMNTEKGISWWSKTMNKIKSTTEVKKWATLKKGDSQAKVVSRVGKPNSSENDDEDSTKELWIYECGSEGKRSITFKDGFMVKIEVKF